MGLDWDLLFSHVNGARKWSWGRSTQKSQVSIKSQTEVMAKKIKIGFLDHNNP